MKILTNVHDGVTCVTSTETTSDDSGRRFTTTVNTLAARRDYLDNMGSVDDANRQLMLYRYRHRIVRWKIAMLLWYFKLGIHNSRLIYNSRNIVEIDQKTFIMQLCSLLSPIIPPNADTGSQLKASRKALDN